MSAHYAPLSRHLANPSNPISNVQLSDGAFSRGVFEIAGIRPAHSLFRLVVSPASRMPAATQDAGRFGLALTVGAAVFLVRADGAAAARMSAFLHFRFHSGDVS